MALLLRNNARFAPRDMSARSVAASYKPPMLVTRVRLPARAFAHAHVRQSEEAKHPQQSARHPQQSAYVTTTWAICCKRVGHGGNWANSACWASWASSAIPFCTIHLFSLFCSFCQSSLCSLLTVWPVQPVQVVVRSTLLWREI